VLDPAVIDKETFSPLNGSGTGPRPPLRVAHREDCAARGLRRMRGGRRVGAHGLGHRRADCLPCAAGASTSRVGATRDRCGWTRPTSNVTAAQPPRGAPSPVSYGRAPGAIGAIGVAGSRRRIRPGVGATRARERVASWSGARRARRPVE